MVWYFALRSKFTVIVPKSYLVVFILASWHWKILFSTSYRYGM